MFHYRALCFILAAILFSGFFNAYAAPSDELAKTQEEIRKEKALSEKLADEHKILKQKSAKLSKKMVKTAADLQQSEAKLSSIEEKLRIITEQITERTDALIARKKDLAVMIQAAIKLSQTPEEAIILMPGDMMNNMKASRALKMTADSIKHQTQSINEQMNELEILKEIVKKNQEEAIIERAQLEEQRALLKTQIAEHKALQKELNIKQKKTKERTKSLSKKAENLQDLIKKLEEEKRQEAERQRKEEIITANTSQQYGERGKLRSFKAAKGYIRIPAAGKLLQKYGSGGLNKTSKGITITTRANAQVTSPYDGEVLFTGLFMEYGKVIIIRHSDGFHTLLAGMTKIDASVGDFLLEGEPIGDMGDRESNNHIYMELRYNTQPIDPTPWIYGLNK
jgi:septal ring factor EnvC (AmiA/AmiB activator)